MEINEDSLIFIIEKRLVIWDTTTSDYPNRTIKIRAYGELVSIDYDMEDTKERKKLLNKHLLLIFTNFFIHQLKNDIIIDIFNYLNHLINLVIFSCKN